MSGSRLCEYDYPALAEIVVRVVLALGDGDTSHCATKIADVLSRVAAELAAEGRLSEPAPKGEEILPIPASVSPSPVLEDPDRERLRIKAVRYMKQNRRGDFHPKVIGSMPSPTLRFPLEPSDCISDNTLFCRFDGEAVDNLATHVRVQYGLDWEEYLLLAELPKDFPRKRTMIKRALKNIALRERAERVRRSKGRPPGYHAEWARRKRAAVAAEAEKASAEGAATSIDKRQPSTNASGDEAGEVEKVAASRRSVAPQAAAQKTPTGNGRALLQAPSRHSDQMKGTNLVRTTTATQPRAETPSDPPVLSGSPSTDRSKPRIIIDIGASVTYDKIYCLFDGVGRSMITRHIRQRWGMTWSQYLAYCNLPPDYPRVAQAYSERTSQKMVEVLSPRRPPTEEQQRKRREKALQVKLNHLLVSPTRGLVDDPETKPRTTLTRSSSSARMSPRPSLS